TLCFYKICFFFSSRRRHTRSKRDWSSDVCSSDLAVLFVAYLQFFGTALSYFQDVSFNTLNVYRVAIPAFVGMILMTFPDYYFDTIPTILRPFLSNGLLVGVLLALLLENIINWDKIK